MEFSQILDIIRKSIKSYAPEARTFLYGSRARGDAREDSDIDLLILLPDSYDGPEFVKRKLDISGMLYTLSLKHNVEISPLILVPKIFNQRKTPFTINVMNECFEL